VRFRTLLLALGACLPIACNPSTDAPSPGPSSGTNQPSPVDAAPAKAESGAATSRPRGRPLPAFSGWTLEDQKLDVSELIGRRLLILFFNPDVRKALPAARAVNAIAQLRGQHNFEVIGIATAAKRADATAFAKREKLAFPVIDDSSAALANRFGLRTPIAILGTDSEGYVVFGRSEFGTDDPRAIETALRSVLRLPSLDGDTASRQEAPGFTATVLDGEEPFDLASQRGRPVVLIFFLHTCPHCHESLEFLKTALTELPEDKRPLLVGVEVSGRTHAVRQQMRDLGLDFFPVLFDDDGSIQASYGVFGGVPDIFLVDAEGRIRSRTQGWSAERDEPLTKMRLARISGVEAPMLLRTGGYSGSEVCGVCHEAEYETWSFTTHAAAFDTLVKHGADHDAECVGCHVVGKGKPGGFLDAAETPDLEDVGCESCHGRGGPHLSQEFVKLTDYSAICVSCHDTKHSLGFDYASFMPRISHKANAPLLSMSAEEKRRLLAERGRPGGSLLPESADYVGSEACRSCHEAEFATWAASPHAHAVDSLAAKGKTADPSCLVCHTTAFDRTGGFPRGGSVEALPDLARVGCESCHGPGSDHVAESAVRIGNILSLGDKCDSCVILQICGSCHDEANDPGFEFQVLERIERQRHGTIEPGTGKPKGPSASVSGTEGEGSGPGEATGGSHATAWKLR
jgi:peroxiredoxin